jgi:proline dehydrogenase
MSAAGGPIGMRALFLYLARRDGFRNFVLKFRFFRNTAERFIAGETLDEAVRAVRQANGRRIRATLDLLGENTLSREDALRACGEIMQTEDRIHAEHVECNMSVKLTQLGLDLDPEFCGNNLFRIAEHAGSLGNFVRVDMEGSAYTDRTLDIVDRTYLKLGNVGTVIQAYLHRSERDVLRLMDRGIRIRLVKGAYREPKEVAFHRKKDTDASYVKLMKTLLVGGNYPAIATHDESIIRAAEEFARSAKVPKERFEFQMLYGIRRDLQQRLAAGGYNVRVYIPFGTHWYPYFMRRLAERPANVIFLVRSLLLERKTHGKFNGEVHEMRR